MNTTPFPDHFPDSDLDDTAELEPVGEDDTLVLPGGNTREEERDVILIPIVAELSSAGFHLPGFELTNAGRQALASFRK